MRDSKESRMALGHSGIGFWCPEEAKLEVGVWKVSVMQST
jgi:hypothetical protein